MKSALAMFCSLLLILGQAAAWSAPLAGAGSIEKSCGCGGKMACCKTSSAPVRVPLAATAQLGSQNQLLSPVPAVMVWVLAAAGTASISPTVSASLTASVAPLFARNCVRLI